MNTEPSPHDQLMRFILAKWICKPIYAVAELGIADLLGEGPRYVEDLARMTRVKPDLLYRVLRALASVGIFAEGQERRFQLTPMASLLQSGSLRSTAMTFHSAWNDRAWMHLLDGLRSGDTPFEEAFGTDLVDWLEANPRDAELLHQANAVRSAQFGRAVCEAYDFSRFTRLTDVGGGYGTLLLEILAVCPTLTGIVADLAPLSAAVEKAIQARGIGERCRFVQCDFFKGVPAGSDAYILANILHDWPDEKAAEILKNCRRAMAADATLLILEMIVPSGNAPSVAKLLDLEMMVVTGGRERSQGEFRRLLDSAGFSLQRILPIDQDLALLEASPQVLP
ncbi:MAG: hypothetical protein JSV89_17345 [Spirochaetaceae bacterium]|nr:MAG: hypothetical protein JSV89_17345 [Spirochaetaceae bacterium]